MGIDTCCKYVKIKFVNFGMTGTLEFEKISVQGGTWLYKSLIGDLTISKDYSSKIKITKTNLYEHEDDVYVYQGNSVACINDIVSGVSWKNQKYSTNIQVSNLQCAGY